MPLLHAPARARTRDDWARALQQGLNDHLVSDCDGKLTLSQFGMGNQGGRVAMASVIRLDWPPGIRSRRFDANGSDEQAVFEQLLNQALFSFAKAWPGCVV